MRSFRFKFSGIDGGPKTASRVVPAKAGTAEFRPMRFVTQQPRPPPG
ncbi:MAG: hypothetical protein JWN66_4692 [Sphingomonas bacterium]|nr:hypothetical protein [Sphingomonas bacterium]